MSLVEQKLKNYQLAKENVIYALKKIEIEQKARSESLEKQLIVMVESLIETKKTVDRELTQYVESKRDILHQQGKLIEIERKLLDETYSFCTKILRCGSDFISNLCLT